MCGFNSNYVTRDLVLENITEFDSETYRYYFSYITRVPGLFLLIILVFYDISFFLWHFFSLRCFTTKKRDVSDFIG